MPARLIAIRLPADWDNDFDRTTEVLIERIRALSDERLMALDDELALHCADADEVRDQLAASTHTLLHEASATVLEENLLVAEYTEDGVDGTDALVALRNENLCDELISPAEIPAPSPPAGQE